MIDATLLAVQARSVKGLKRYLGRACEAEGQWGRVRTAVHGHDDRGCAVLEGAVLCDAVEVGANDKVAKDKERILQARGGKGVHSKDKQRRLGSASHEHDGLAMRACRRRAYGEAGGKVVDWHVLLEQVGCIPHYGRHVRDRRRVRALAAPRRGERDLQYFMPTKPLMISGRSLRMSVRLVAWKRTKRRHAAIMHTTSGPIVEALLGGTAARGILGAAACALLCAAACAAAPIGMRELKQSNS